MNWEKFIGRIWISRLVGSIEWPPELYVRICDCTGDRSFDCRERATECQVRVTRYFHFNFPLHCRYYVSAAQPLWNGTANSSSGCIVGDNHRYQQQEQRGWWWWWWCFCKIPFKSKNCDDELLVRFNWIINLLLPVIRVGTATNEGSFVPFLLFGRAGENSVHKSSFVASCSTQTTLHCALNRYRFITESLHSTAGGCSLSLASSSIQRWTKVIIIGHVGSVISALSYSFVWE